MTMTTALDASGFAPASKAARSDVRTRAERMAAFRPLVPLVTAMGVMALLVFGIQYGRSAGMVTALWGASGIAIGMWLRSGRGLLHDLCFAGLIGVGIVAGELIVGNTLAQTATFALANLAEIALAVFLVRQFAPHRPLASVKGALILLGLAGVVAPLSGAVIATAGVTGLGLGDPAAAFQTWWFGHALGICVLVPTILSIDRRTWISLANWRRVAEWVALFGVLIPSLWFAYFVSSERVSFLALPWLMLIAARLRLPGIGVALVLVAVFAIVGTIAKVGAGPHLSHTVIMAQLSLMCCFAPFILVAVLLDERDALGERALQAQRRAERASEGKSRLLANVSHEIKSPIGGVIGIAELWRDGRLGAVDQQQAEMSDMLVKTARQIEVLARDLLDVAQAEAGAVSVDIKPVDLGGLLEDIRRSANLSPEARKTRIEIADQPERLVAMADSVRLSQVLTNLTSNALKYGASGGLITLSADRVGEDRVRLTVRDYGPGLTEAKQAELFEPFNRLGMEKTTVEGHGIGLALAKRLVEMQDGRIGVDSAPGEGAAFWVELRAAD